MEDKQVGELWRAACTALDNEGICTLWAKAVINLIRKLVEERAENTQINLPEYSKWTWQDCVNDALRDFGIDPESWK